MGITVVSRYCRKMFLLAFVASCITLAVAQGPPTWAPGGCGQSKYADAGDMFLPSGFIVGGMDAREHEFPWQASVRRKSSDSHFCGGSVINDRWILTAAHCMVGEFPAIVSIVVGDHTRNDGSNTVRQHMDVESIHVHPSYNSRTYENDVAVVKTTAAIPLSADIYPVCAPDPANNYEYQKSQCSGWGTLYSGGPCCPQTLQYVTLNITTNSFCDAEYSSDDIFADMICASDNIGGTDRDSCQGDSGGPLTVKDGNGVFTIVGVVSWGIGCASGYPGVYARVSYQNNWITTTINSN